MSDRHGEGEVEGPAHEPPVAAWLVEVGLPHPRRFPLGGLTTIGRGHGSDVRIDDPLVGSRHAEIRRSAQGAFELVDLGSRAGTWVGDRRVSSAVLREGDELLVGAARLKFEQAAAPAPEGWSQLRRSADGARAAIELTSALEEAPALPDMLLALLRTTLAVVGAERGTVLLLGEGTAQPSIQLGLTGDGRPAQVRLSTSLINEVVTRQAGILATSIPDDPRLSAAESLVGQEVRRAMCVPLTHHGERLGVLHLDSRASGSFTEENLQLVSALARQAGVAIRNAVLAEKVRSVEALERQRLERLLSDLPDGVLLVEGDGRIAFANPRAPELLALLGVPADAQVLERVGDHALGELVAAGEPVEIVTLGPPARVVQASAREASVSPGSVLLVLRDVTREREREARVAHQERLAVMGQLAAGIAHDFNNLLAVITNFAQFVLDSLPGGQQEDDQRQVLEAAGRASQLAKQLLAFGRRELVQPQVVRLDRVVASLERLIRGSTGEHIELRTAFTPGLAHVKVDPAMFGQVVLNLAVNARDAMPGGGTLTLGAANEELAGPAAEALGLPPGRYVALDVTDTGTGMPEDVARRVFEPFFTTKVAGKGTGLGLATAQGIVRQAGGAMRLRTRVGEGSTFSVLLPATSEPGALPDDGRHRAGRGVGTILVVEDERPVRDLTRRILADAGYEVLDAGTGAEALEVAAGHAGPIDLLLADVIMPGVTGKQLAEQLAAARPGLRVMYMSGYFQDGVGGPARPFLAKPFDRATLLERVHAVLAPGEPPPGPPLMAATGRVDPGT